MKLLIIKPDSGPLEEAERDYPLVGRKPLTKWSGVKPAQK
jgi:hypothetical protein